MLDLTSNSGGARQNCWSWGLVCTMGYFDYGDGKHRCMHADPVNWRNRFRLPTTFLITGMSNTDVCMPTPWTAGREHVEVSPANHIFDYRGVEHRCMRVVGPTIWIKRARWSFAYQPLFDYRGPKRSYMRAVGPVSGRKESKDENTLKFRLPTTFLITGVPSADVCVLLIPWTEEREHGEVSPGWHAHLCSGLYS